ncbi:hypothetical protein [Actinoplanes sp. NPDC026623]|uniref:hypothetical protein n=1 Tax=Actinoplanes sp. NPDC026623 TaxID=3155610 RepID=UPI0033C5B05E
MVDRELRVEMWNRRAEDLWGLRAAEVRSALPEPRHRPTLGKGTTIAPRRARW